MVNRSLGEESLANVGRGGSGEWRARINKRQSWIEKFGIALFGAKGSVIGTVGMDNDSGRLLGPGRDSMAGIGFE